MANIAAAAGMSRAASAASKPSSQAVATSLGSSAVVAGPSMVWVMVSPSDVTHDTPARRIGGRVAGGCNGRRRDGRGRSTLAAPATGSSPDDPTRPPGPRSAPRGDGCVPAASPRVPSPRWRRSPRVEVESRRTSSALAPLLPSITASLEPVVDDGLLLVVTDTDGRVLWQRGAPAYAASPTGSASCRARRGPRPTSAPTPSAPASWSASRSTSAVPSTTSSRTRGGAARPRPSWTRGPVRRSARSTSAVRHSPYSARCWPSSG